MKTALLLISVLLSNLSFAAPAADRQVNANPTATSDYQTCVFESADVGKMKFRGSSREEAFEKTARACLQARVQGYIKLRGDVPSSDRKVLFAEDCVNKTYCKH